MSITTPLTRYIWICMFIMCTFIHQFQSIPAIDYLHTQMYFIFRFQCYTEHVLSIVLPDVGFVYHTNTYSHIQISVSKLFFISVAHVRSSKSSSNTDRINSTKAKMFLQILFSPLVFSMSQINAVSWVNGFFFENESSLQYNEISKNTIHRHNLAQISSQFHQWYSKLHLPTVGSLLLKGVPSRTNVG